MIQDIVHIGMQALALLIAFALGAAWRSLYPNSSHDEEEFYSYNNMPKSDYGTLTDNDQAAYRALQEALEAEERLKHRERLKHEAVISQYHNTIRWTKK